MALALLTAAATLGLPTYGGAQTFVPTIRSGAARIAAGGLARLPFRANLISVSFASLDRTGRGVSVSVRVHGARGWGAWEAQTIDPEEGPDGVELRRADPRVFTEPLWVGTTDRVVVRIRRGSGAARLSDARVHLVNSKGDATAPGLLGRIGRAIGRFLTARPASAQPATPGIVTRAGWGANESWRNNGAPRYATGIKMAFVHHTAGSNSYSRSESPAIVRAIYRYHRYTRKWSDIGYNFLVDRYGQIFEGRYGGMTRPLIGAHVQGFNTGTVGVSLMGTFDKVSPPRAMLASLERLLAWRLDVVYVPPTGKVLMTSGGSDKYDAGTKVWMNRISGHRDGQATDCPGGKTYGLLGSIRKVVEGTGNPKIYLPTISGTVLRPDGDDRAESVTVRTNFSRSVSWTVSFADASGTVARAFFGSGTSAEATWGGTSAAGGLAPTGMYAWRIEARAGSASARAAQRSVAVVTSHPEGTLLSDSQGTYQLAALPDGSLAARPVPAEVFPTWFQTPAVGAGLGERGRYLPGTPLAAREGALLQVSQPDGTAKRYIVSQGQSRMFSSDEVFAALGYDPETVLPASAASLPPPGVDVTDPTQHPTGSVVRASLPDGTTATWVVSLAADGSATRRPIGDLALRSAYRANEPVAATEADLATPEDTESPVGVRDGTLLRLEDGSLWLVSAGERRRFSGTWLFTAMGFSRSMALAATAAEVESIPVGAQIR